MTFFEFLQRILLMKHWVQLFQEVIEGQTSTTVMAFKVGVILDRIQISPRLVFVLLGVPTDRAAEVIEIRLNPLEFL